MSKNQSTKMRTIIGVAVLLFANSSAGGAEWCTSALADIAARFPDVPYSIITLVNNIPNLCAVIFTVVAGRAGESKDSIKENASFGDWLSLCRRRSSRHIWKYKHCDGVCRAVCIRRGLWSDAGNRRVGEF